ncbi:dihydroorotase [Sagittula stellata E-37]|uniref:Dihydroorotase n=2 Tax=Sagittula stellata TaxID=52603 RepID=A3JYW4_SAGS3|nr:dihydroorotase [Sagittula stellata E-37]
MQKGVTMLLTVILGAAAGWGAKHVEPQVTDRLYRWLGSEHMIAEQDRGVAALLVCLLAAAVLLSLLGEGGRVFLFSLFAALGYFQEDLREAFLRRGS